MDHLVNRPLVALGLVAIALSLLTVLVADMQQAVEDPHFELSEQGVDAAAKAAEKLGPKAGDALHESGADSLTLPDGATVTLPEGTEIDGDMIRLAQALDWTLPDGTELANLELELPEGVGFEIPEDTWADGDTLVFPPGSTLRLDDGTVLELPEGGRLTMPGASSAEMMRMLEAGQGVTREGSTFTAPTVVTDGAWPVTFPPGTEFTMPDDMTLPQGTLESDMDVQIPPGSELQTSTADAQAGEGNSLFDKIGALDLNKDTGTSETPGAGGSAFAGLPAFAAGTWWMWTLAGVALVVAAWLLWRHRKRLGALLGRGAATSGDARDAPARIVYTIDDRPAGLPLALEPGTTGSLHLAVQARHVHKLAPATGHDAASDAGTVRSSPETRTEWRAAAAEVRLTIDGEPWTNRALDVTGTRIPIPPLEPGTHQITATLTSSEFGGPVTLTSELHVALWNEQVARDYQHLYDHAHATLELPDGLTPRMLASALRARIESFDDAHLDDLIRTFEIANYGTAKIDQAGWIRFAEGVARFVAALDAIAAARPPNAAPAAPTAPSGAAAGHKPRRTEPA